MSRFIKYKLSTADSDSANSLAGITNYEDLDIAYVQDPNHYFRFFAADTTTPDGRLIIAPDNITPPAPGRWLRQGPPGPAIPDPSKPAALAVAGFGGNILATELAETQVLSEVFEYISDLDTRVDSISASSRLLLEAVIGGTVAGTNVAPLVHLVVQEYDSDDNLLSTTTLLNSRQQSPIVTATQNAVVPTSGIYTRQDADTSYVICRVQGAAATPDAGSWTLNPATGVSGGAVLKVTRLV